MSNSREIQAGKGFQDGWAEGSRQGAEGWSGEGPDLVAAADLEDDGDRETESGLGGRQETESGPTHLVVDERITDVEDEVGVLVVVPLVLRPLRGLGERPLGGSGLSIRKPASSCSQSLSL